jgi:hypothetical protein
VLNWCRRLAQLDNFRLYIIKGFAYTQFDSHFNHFQYRRYYSSVSSNSCGSYSIEELHATLGELPAIRSEWLCGFADAESCFYVNIRKNKAKTGYQVVLTFFINQAAVSASSLFAIKKYFGCGTIRWNDADRKYLRFEIGSNRDIIEKVIPFFEQFPLKTSKQLNFLDLKKVAEIIKANKDLTSELIQEIQSIKSSMNSRRSFSEKESFMNARRDNIIITPGWLSGFIDGEAHLGVYISEKPRRRCEPKFSISQNTHDVAILEAIANFLGTSNKIVDNTGLGSTVKQLSVYDFNTRPRPAGRPGI